MKRRILSVLVGIVVMAMVGTPGEAQPASKAKPVELRVASYLPDSHYLNKTLERLFEEVQKRTGGKVRFAYYHASSLVGAKEAFSGTVKGRCDIYNMLVPAYTPGRFPLTSLIDLAPNIPYATDASIAFWDFFNKHLKDEWKDVKVLGVCVQVPQHIHMGKTPVRDFSDMKGKQLRVYGAGKDIPPGAGTGLFGCQGSSSNLLRHPAMILGKLLEPSIAQKVDTAISYVCDGEGRPGQQGYRQGAPHAPGLRLGGRLVHFRIYLLHHLCQRAGGASFRDRSCVPRTLGGETPHQSLNGHGASQSPCLMTTHPIGDCQEGIRPRRRVG